jgi:zinc/manganese transport system substrate-binding protein
VLPVGLFTRAVAGSCAVVEPLLPAGADLHDLPVTPSLVGRLRGADVLVLNGLGLEAPLEGLLASAGGARPRRIDASATVAPLPDGTPNPHVWLDPRRAAGQVRTIRDGLVAADPARAACFRRNAALYLADLESLDGDLARQLAPHAGRPLVSFHDLAPYFAERYGLRAESVVGLPEESPSAADLRRVADTLRGHRVSALLVDPNHENRSLRAVAADLGLSLLPFDPIERASETDARRPAHYLEVMRRNGAVVAASLAKAAPAAPDATDAGSPAR